MIGTLGRHPNGNENWAVKSARGYSVHEMFHGRPHQHLCVIRHAVSLLALHSQLVYYVGAIVENIRVPSVMVGATSWLFGKVSVLVPVVRIHWSQCDLAPQPFDTGTGLHVIRLDL